MLPQCNISEEEQEEEQEEQEEEPQAPAPSKGSGGLFGRTQKVKAESQVLVALSACVLWIIACHNVAHHVVCVPLVFAGWCTDDEQA